MSGLADVAYWQANPNVTIRLDEVVAFLVGGPFSAPPAASNGHAAKSWTLSVATRTCGLVPCGSFPTEGEAREKLREGLRAILKSSGFDPAGAELL